MRIIIYLKLHINFNLKYTLYFIQFFFEKKTKYLLMKKILYSIQFDDSK